MKQDEVIASYQDLLCLHFLMNLDARITSFQAKLRPVLVSGASRSTQVVLAPLIVCFCAFLLVTFTIWFKCLQLYAQESCQKRYFYGQADRKVDPPHTVSLTRQRCRLNICNYIAG